jgi:hypothetical protein
MIRRPPAIARRLATVVGDLETFERPPITGKQLKDFDRVERLQYFLYWKQPQQVRVVSHNSYLICLISLKPSSE